MKQSRVLVLLVVLLTAWAVGTMRAAGRSATVKGYVIDSACTFVKNLKKPISSECAVACAKAGSPLVILADDGIIYWPISADVPAAGQNARLLPFAGKRVVAAGTVYERGGSRAMVIERIEGASKP
jgi:hypothetical protein